MLLAGLLLTACVPASVPAGDRAVAVEPCPPSVPAGDVAVPSAPTADTLGRLVPQQPPSEALLCRYAPDGTGAAPLTGQVALAGGLERLPQDLLLPGGTGVPACDAGTAGSAGPSAASLLRLTYPDGVVWVAAAGTCAGTSNGPFTSGYDRSDVLAASFAASAWTVPAQPDADQRCVPERTGRAGQEFALLPGGSTSLVLCRVAGDGVARRVATDAQRAQVQDVLDEPVASRQPVPCAQTPEQYELVARYPAGPAVQVAYVPGCAADVGNGSLTAALEPAGQRRLRAVLAEAFGPA